MAAMYDMRRELVPCQYGLVVPRVVDMGRV